MPKQRQNLSQASVSEYNRSRILDHLYRHGVSSRAQIAKALGLTPAAITKITALLIDVGLIEETGKVGVSRNHRSVGLKLDSTRFQVIGVKFARSLVQIGVFDLSGRCTSLLDLPTVDEHTIHKTILGIRRTISDLLNCNHRIVAIGMVVPGPYLRSLGHTAVVSSMQDWRKVNFITEFTHQFPVPVFIEQDARAGTLAEHLFNPNNHCQNLAYYLLGEGIGLGVMDHGRLIDGAMGTATELGHVSIDVSGRHCDCGNSGCLECYCSAVAVHQLIRERHLLEDADSMTHRQACQALFDQAHRGHEQSRHAVRQIGHYVGFGCVTIINAFNPERIVLGDILSAGGPTMLTAVQEIIDDRVIPELNESTNISLSSLPIDATVSGAAATAISQFLRHPSLFFSDGFAADLAPNSPVARQTISKTSKLQ